MAGTAFLLPTSHWDLFTAGINPLQLQLFTPPAAIGKGQTPTEDKIIVLVLRKFFDMRKALKTCNLFLLTEFTFPCAIIFKAPGMTQRCASQETVPAPVGDSRAPPPCAPAQELILQLSTNSQPLLELTAHLQARESLSLLLQILSLRKELLFLFPQDGPGPLHMHSLKGLEHLWGFSNENHCLQCYSPSEI